MSKEKHEEYIEEFHISVLQRLGSFMGITVEELRASQVNLNVRSFNRVFFCLIRKYMIELNSDAAIFLLLYSSFSPVFQY